jgi:diguanylate cyclase (GGDEF)-like protein
LYFCVVKKNAALKPVFATKTATVDAASLYAVVDALDRRLDRDALTGLADQTSFLRAVAAAIAESVATNRSFAVVVIDLDGFHRINGSLGFAAGDVVLRATAERLAAGRGDRDAVARIAADRFVLLVRDLEVEDRILFIGHGLRRRLGQPLSFEGFTVSLTASVGLALFPRDAATPETLLSAASRAVCRAKMLGGDRLERLPEVVDPGHPAAPGPAEQLRRALAVGRLVLRYRPQIDLRSGGIVGTSAHLRWRHTPTGRPRPDELLPAAPSSDIAYVVGAWMLAEACRQLRAWRRSGAPGRPLSVGLPRALLDDPALDDLVARILDGTGVDARALVLRVPPLSVADVDPVRENLLRLHAIGVGLVMDNFRFGVAPVECLHRMPVQAIRLDPCYIRDLSPAADDVSLLSVIIALARNAGVRVVAVGVETADRAERLRALGCDEAEGPVAERPTTKDLRRSRP